LTISYLLTSCNQNNDMADAVFCSELFLKLYFRELNEVIRLGVKEVRLSTHTSGLQKT